MPPLRALLAPLALGSVLPLMPVAMGSMALTPQRAVAREATTQPFPFPPGSRTGTVSGSIRGHQYADYTLPLEAGQKIQVNLSSPNPTTYFNVVPTGSNIAIYNGSILGASWSGAVTEAGSYTIRVYQMGNARDTKQVSTFTLTAKLGRADRAGRGGDAKVSGTPYNATGTVPCSMGKGQLTTSCSFGVRRSGGGSGSVTITRPDGGTRTIQFQNGQAVGYDSSQADPARFRATKQADLFIVTIAAERYEIPEAVIFGG